MATIECLILGAGQDVGKSCVVVTINGKRIMFDCGLHLSYTDHRRYPDFSLISKSGDFTNELSCIIITHSHLDHIGALPYFTEVCGYRGPIYMTYPTKALGPLMLEDNRRVMVDRLGEGQKFSSQHIVDCMNKVTAVDLKQTIQVDKDLQIRAYYAGHVIGAAMFYAKVRDAAIVYTGDYNMTPDRHLGAAQIDRLPLDLVITESTFATTFRDTKYAKEQEFLKVVHKCVAGGGKVLIPTFASGRSQELCMLLDDYWERMNLKVPIYFSAGLIVQVNMYHKMFVKWTSQKVKEAYATHNACDFKNVCNFDRSMINALGPCVLFATPGMLIGGFSLEVFKQWAPYEGNLVAFGHCLPGTIGHKLLAKLPSTIRLDDGTQVDVRCQVYKLSFSAHTDAKGIMDLIKFLSPKNVILVHGEKPKMAKLTEKIRTELKIECSFPANNETVTINSSHSNKALATDEFLKSCSNPNFKFVRPCTGDTRMTPLQVFDDRIVEAVVIGQENEQQKVVHQKELENLLSKPNHSVTFSYCCPVVCNEDTKMTGPLLHRLSASLSDKCNDLTIQACEGEVRVESFIARVCSNERCPRRSTSSCSFMSTVVYFCCTWSCSDDELAWKIISIMKDFSL